MGVINNNYLKQKVIFIFVFILYISSVACANNHKIAAKHEAILIMKKVEVLLSTHPDSVLQYIEKGIQKSDEAKNDKLRARFYELAGKFYAQSYNFIQAIEFYNKASGIFDSLGFNIGISSVNNELGILQLDIGELQKAEKYFLRSQEYIESEANKASLWVNIGNAYLSKGEYGKAMQMYLQSKSIFEENSDSTHLSAIMVNFAMIFYHKQDYNKALQYYDSAIVLKNPLLQKRQIINCKIGKAAAYLSLKEFDKARTILLNVANNGIDWDDYTSYGMTYFELGTLELQTGNCLKAEEHYITSLNWYKKASKSINIAEVLHALGKTMLCQQKTTNAIAFFNQSLELSERHLTQALLLKNYSMLITTYVSLKNYNKAYHLQDKYFTLKGKYAVETQKREISFYEAKEQLNKKEQELEKLDNMNKENQIQIQKGKYQKALLISLIILIAFVALWLIQKVKIKFLRRQKQYEKHKLEVENKLLRNQFNPHFIFNCLSSVQAYISENKLRDAAIYLARFSKLMRHVLNGTRNDLISLNEELDFFKLYLEIESECFNNGFDFEINCQTNYEKTEILIPPFIIQPFIENAIKHGISQIKQKGMIQINYTFCENENIMQCTIIDNGIGLANQSQNCDKRHESIGLKLIEERLNIYQHAYKQKLEFKIQKNKWENGTEVTIIIPYFYKK